MTRVRPSCTGVIWVQATGKLPISVPSTVTFPASCPWPSIFWHFHCLREITNPELRAFLAGHDPTPDSPLESGAVDWADLPDRLHYIVDLFRCYQEEQALFSPPFTAEQVAVLKTGRVPAGRL